MQRSDDTITSDPQPVRRVEVPLTQGYFAIVDIDDHDLVSRYKWRIRKCRGHLYATTSVGSAQGVTDIYMHRLLLGTKAGESVDHVDGDGLNNSRANIRICTQSQNLANRALSPRNTSGYRGVSRGRRVGKWRARIGDWQVGEFDNPEDAARAYDAAAAAQFGQFARLNFDDGLKPPRRSITRGRTGYRGIYFDPRTSRYVAQISPRGNYKYLGSFPTPQDAARAYDEAAKESFGDKAILNFP